MRLVFSDLDGTFLTPEKELTAANLAALDLLAAHGVGFVPCTGRPCGGIPAPLLAHPTVRFAISANGAAVTDVPAARVIRRSLIGPARVRALYEAVGDLDVTFDLFADGKVFAERARYDALDTFGLAEPVLNTLRALRTPVDQTIPQLLDEVTYVERLGLYWKRPEDRDAIVEAVGRDETLSWVSSHPRNVEVSDAETSKGAALVWLCSYLGIPVAQVVAFGDSSNDAAMLAAAGDGVAMASGTDEAKAAADHTTPAGNDDSGVGRYLEELFRRL
ncbi:MAG: HAD family hydrolase [Atopobiaceae bacterium]|jgi:Cof subfamily protein (haloacid dehalogenase superfamily)|nr:HAD family hydrolase [Atopobiaceae bacterium]